MTLRAGHCTTCDAEIFRHATHGRTGERVMLYPTPTSVYALVRWVDSMPPVPGVGYCAEHAPPLGGDVLGLEAAGHRYAYWYSPKFGAHLRAWVADHLELPEHEQAALMDRWLDDVKAVEGVAIG